MGGNPFDRVASPESTSFPYLLTIIAVKIKGVHFVLAVRSAIYCWMCGSVDTDQMPHQTQFSDIRSGSTLFAGAFMSKYLG